MADITVSPELGGIVIKNLKSLDSKKLINLDPVRKQYIIKELRRRTDVKNETKLNLKKSAAKNLLKSIPKDVHSDLILEALQTKSKHKTRYIKDAIFPYEFYDRKDTSELKEYYEFLDAFIEKFPNNINNYSKLFLFYELREYLFDDLINFHPSFISLDNITTNESEDLSESENEYIIESLFSDFKYDTKGSIIDFKGDTQKSLDAIEWAEEKGYDKFLDIGNFNLGNVLVYVFQIFKDIDPELTIEKFKTLSGVSFKIDTQGSESLRITKIVVIR